MKFIHLADLHLGKTVNEKNMLEDQKDALFQVLQTIDKKVPDGVVIAGDIYDRSVPPVEAVSLFDWFLTEVSKKNVFVCIIGGNHDSGKRLDFGARFFKEKNIFVEGFFRGIPQKVIFQDEYGDVIFHLLPFFKPVEARQYHPEVEIHTFEDGMKAVMEAGAVDKTKRNVLVTHQFVCGMDAMEESESEQQLQIGGTDQISYELFKDFNYVALGHLHGPQQAGRNEIRYSGSLLKYSFSEENQKKSLTYVEIDEKGKVIIELLPLTPLHEMRTIKGPLNELISEEISSQGDTNDYIRAYLTDKEELMDPAAKLRTVYPNLMELRLEKRDDMGENRQTVIDLKEKTPLDLVGDFMELTMGEKEEERMEWLKELLNEGRVES